MSVVTSMTAMRPIDEQFCNSVIENVTCRAAGTDQACVDACVGKYNGLSEPMCEDILGESSALSCICRLIHAR